MDLPGFGVIQGQWDCDPGLMTTSGGSIFGTSACWRSARQADLSHFEMERRGGGRYSRFEVTDEPGWDFVPFPRDVLAPHMTSRRQHMHALKNSWWFAREQYGASAKMCYGDVYNLPDEIGEFDIAIMGAGPYTLSVTGANC